MSDSKKITREGIVEICEKILNHPDVKGVSFKIDFKDDSNISFYKRRDYTV